MKINNFNNKKEKEKRVKINMMKKSNNKYMIKNNKILILKNSNGKLF